jgi:hypothetical protein
MAMTSSTVSPTRAARQAAHSKWISALARLGLATRGFVYLLIGVLAIAVAAGRSAQPDQQGALHAVARHSGGRLLLVLVTIGLFGYALWRFSEAAFGVAGDTGNAARVKSLVRGVAYAALGVTAISVLAGSSDQSQAHRQQSTSARLMSHTGGQLLVGAVGVIVVGVGIAMVVEGVRRKFLKDLEVSEMGSTARSVVTTLGVVGNPARGLIFAIAGGLVVDAAAQHNAHKARGLDGALMTLSHQAYGTVLLAVAATGLIIFGCYGFAEARWHKT